MDAYELLGLDTVEFKWPVTPRVPSSILWVFAHQVISLLPDGCTLEMWSLHAKDKVVSIGIGWQIAICWGQGDLDGRWSKPIAIATVIGIAYCDREQVIFHMKIKGDTDTSLLSMPVGYASISYFRKLLHWILSINQPSPPPLQPYRGFRSPARQSHSSNMI